MVNGGFVKTGFGGWVPDVLVKMPQPVRESPARALLVTPAFGYYRPLEAPTVAQGPASCHPRGRLSELLLLPSALAQPGRGGHRWGGPEAALSLCFHLYQVNILFHEII